MRYFYCFLFCLLMNPCAAQLMGFNLPEGEEMVEIPFEFRNNFIIVKVIFDEVFPLEFIFDTGSENTILVKKEFTDILNISYDRTFKVMGADLEKELTAHLVRGVKMDLPNLYSPNVDLLVLQEDYFQFEQYTGLNIHGILGMDLFKPFTIQIDYQKQKLTLHRIEKFRLNSNKYKALPIEVHRNKPYLLAKGKIKSDTTTSLKLLLDTGASLALLLHNNSSEDINLPQKLIPGKIGNGLGGYINGYIGRINQLAFDEFYFNSVITNFQEVDSLMNININKGRNGIIGNEILSRFKIVFDIANSTLYLKPIKKYNKYFKFDKSGITLLASGKTLDVFRVKELIPNSPAEEAGVMVGDIVTNVNFTPAGFYDLRRLSRIFQKRSGKRIRLVVIRNGEKKVFKFRLRDLI